MEKRIIINYNLNETWRLPTTPGVYGIIGNSIIYYIGRSENVRRRVGEQIEYFEQRVNQEIENGVNACSIEVILKDTEEQAADLERRLISQHRPPWNDYLT